MQKNPEFITYDGVDDDKMYSKKVLDKIIDGIEIDYTKHTTVCEFITQIFRERTINQIVQELIMKQNIVLRLFEKHLHGTKLKFPCSGSIFPINVVGEDGKNNITHDYTGSYHLNMTLPYNQGDLIYEQGKLRLYIQRVKNSKQGIMFTQTIYDEWVKALVADCNAECKFTFPFQLPKTPQLSFSADDEYLVNILFKKIL